jgi:hypothetical protein
MDAKQERDRRTTWETYAGAWKAESREAKRAALVASVAPGCVYRDPLTRADGQDALIEAMLAFHVLVPGGWFETTYFLAHHDRSISKWTMRSAAGDTLGEGISYGEYDGTGRLVAMTGFFETPPG